MTLNLKQELVVNSRETLIVVEAAAGSGKSRVLVERIARLVESDVAPSKIVVITFTNQAANVLKERLASRLGKDITLGCCSTLHSFMLRVIKRWGGQDNAGFAVIDSEQTKALLQDAIDETRYKGSLEALEDTVESYDLTKQRLTMSKTEIAAASFFGSLARQNVLTFDMMLTRGLEVLRTLQEWPYDWLFVDEFQDSGKADGEIYEAMPCPNKFFVGDMRQSIYAFRGVNSDNLDRMRWQAGTGRFTLTSNYRSAEVICQAANRLISHSANEGDLPFMLAANEGEGKITLLQSTTAEREIVDVADWVQENPSDDVAVLLRTNFLVQQWADGLENYGVPVRRRKPPAFPHDWLKAKTFLSFLANPENDRLAFAAISLSRGPEVASEVRRTALKELTSINQVATNLPGNQSLAEVMARLPAMGISQESMLMLEELRAGLESDARPEDLIFQIGLESFGGKEEGQGILVTTYHSMKGREADTVILPAFEQGIIPSGKSPDVEEERRLAYVGMTRAKRRLVISHAEKRRPRFGGREHVLTLPSQFLNESGL